LWLPKIAKIPKNFTPILISPDHFNSAQRPPKIEM
jgi:hypothetical protein